MLVVAVATWSKFFEKDYANVHLVGDARGVLQAVTRKRALNALINIIVAEIILILRRSMYSLQVPHIWSEVKMIADKFSSFHGTKELPGDVKGVRCRTAVIPRMKLLK